MPRPMRRFTSAVVVCRHCGERIRYSDVGGWTHVRRLLITRPGWHLAQP